MNRRERAKFRDHGHPPSRSKELTAVEHMHVTIPLKPQEKPVTFPLHFTEAIKEEYAIKYLQRLGATPTQSNIAIVLKNLPLDDCQITSAWKARGSLSDVVMVDLYPKQHASVQVMPESKEQSQQQRRRLEGNVDDDQFDDALANAKRYQVGCVCLSFDDMKRQYLLPFKHGTCQDADVLTMFAMKHEEPVKFVYIPALAEIHTKPTLQLCGRRATQRRIKCVNERVNPPEIKSEFTRQMLGAFFASLPFGSLGIRGDQEKDTLLQFLSGELMVALVDSSVRYLYLEVFFKLGCLGAADLIQSGTVHSYHLSAPAEIEALYVAIVELFTKLKQRLEREEKGISLFLPLHLLALRVAVETIFRCQYPMSFTITAPTMQYILMQMDDQLTKVLDGDQLLSRIGILETTCESSKAMASQPYQIKKRHTKLRDQYYQTSDTLHTIFPNPISGKCRKMIKFRGGAAIANYPIPVVPAPNEPTDIGRHSNEADTVGDTAKASTWTTDHPEPLNTRAATLPRASLEARLQLLHVMERNVASVMEPKPPSRKPKTTRY